MPDSTQPPPDQHSPGSPEPSYARQVLDRMIKIMEQPGNRGRLLSHVGLRRAFNVAVAHELHALPQGVADDATEKAAAVLPRKSENQTHGAYAALLRQAAEEL